MDNYFTVAGSGTAETEIKHSRFIGCAKHVESNDEAIAFIEEIRKKHRDARHNVYAYSVREGQIKRYSDDGEPGGTAGMPVLDVIMKPGITDVCIVVTRYFGGILLGTGGLVRAYTEAAQLALADAVPVEMRECENMRLSCDYGTYGKVSNLLAGHGAINIETEFADLVTVRFSVDSGAAGGFLRAFTDAVAGRIQPEILGKEYVAVEL